MREEIRKKEQAVESSSSFIKNLRGEDWQQAALNKAISNFWDTSDVSPEPAPWLLIHPWRAWMKRKKRN